MVILSCVNGYYESDNVYGESDNVQKSIGGIYYANIRSSSNTNVLIHIYYRPESFNEGWWQ